MSYGPVVEVDDIIQVVAVCQNGDQIGLNVFHYRCTANAPGNPLSQVIDNLVSVITTPLADSYRAVLSAEASFYGYMIRIVSPGLGAVFFDPRGRGAGTAGGPSLPRQVSGIISKRAAIPGRRKGGRLYIPFPGEADNDTDAIPTNDYADRLGALAVGFTNFLQTTTATPFCKPVIAVRTGAVVTSSRDIAAFNAKQVWATQRRRGSFGRTNLPPF